MVLLLISCSNNQSLEQQSDCIESCAKTYVDTMRGFELTIPPELPRWTSLSFGLEGPTYPHFSSDDEGTDLYFSTIFYPTIPCSPSVTGASQTEVMQSTNGETVWGRVDVWEQFGEGDIPDWENVICRKDGTPPPVEVYALCSEKDGKRVLICISQMTDNPQLAEDIFGTFRWEK